MKKITAINKKVVNIFKRNRDIIDIIFTHVLSNFADRARQDGHDP